MKKQSLASIRYEEIFGMESNRATGARNSVRYGECQKNHAASLGGYAVDGCREFMASGLEGTNLALVCAACGCHRNFHRREVETHPNESVNECSSLTGSCSSKPV